MRTWRGNLGACSETVRREGLPGVLALLAVSCLAQPAFAGAGAIAGKWPRFSGEVVGVVVNGSRAYLSVSRFGLVILDISDPASISLDSEPIGVYEGAPAGGLALSDDVAYLAVGETLRTLDVSDPREPRELGVYPRAGIFIASAGYVYSRYTSRVEVIDAREPSRPQLAGSIDEPDALFGDMFISGAHLYVTDGLGGYWVLDVANPARPRRIARYRDDARLSQGIFVAEDLAFLTNGQGEGLSVVDVSDPLRPRRIGGFGAAIGGPVFVEGGHAYVRDAILDVEDPSNPRPVAVFDRERNRSDPPAFVHEILVADGFAYVAHGTEGLRILDVRAPADAERLGAYTRSESAGGFLDAQSVFLSGDLAFLAAGALHIVDVSDPSRPERLGIFADFPFVNDFFASAEDVFVSAGHAYVAGGNGGFHVIDVSDPGAPRHAGALPAEIGLPERGGAFRGVFVSGTRAYAVLDMSFQVMDVTHPARPRVTAELSHSLPGASDVFVQDGLAYVAANRRLAVIDVRDPSAPRTLAVYSGSDAAGDWSGVAVSGNLVYLADGLGSLVVLDASDPANPHAVGSYSTGDARGANDVAISGDRAYVTDGLGFHAVDVSDPRSPRLVARYVTFEAANGISVSGGVAYIAGRGLETIDLDVPPTPDRLTGEYDTSFVVHDVVVAGRHAYVAGDHASLHVIDVSDPEYPRRVGLHEDTRDASSSSSIFLHRVFTDGETAYVVDHATFERSAVQVVDVRDPAGPRLLGTYEADFTAEQSAVEGGYAYLVYTDFDARGLFETRVRIVDLGDPSGPEEVGGYATSGGPGRGLAVANGYAFLGVADAYEIIDVRDPRAPRFVRREDGRPGRPLVSNGRAYVGYLGAEGGGFEILDIADPVTPKALGRYIAASSGYAALRFVSGDRVFIGCLGEDGCVEEIDVSDPSNPRSTGTVYGLVLKWVEGEYAYSAGTHRQEDLLVVDIADRAGRFLRGDCDGDGIVDGHVTDAVFLLRYNFLAGPRPPCLAACDANGDGRVGGQVADAVYLLNYNFLGGSPPVEPFPECGPGSLPGDRELGCDAAGEGCR